MRPLLLVLNPRRIPECVDAIKSLPIDKVWLQNYTEHQLCDVIPQVLSQSEHDLIGVVSDDGAPTPQALDAVLSLTRPGTVITGWCRLDETSDLVNLSTEPLTTSVPCIEAYTNPTADWVYAHPTNEVATYFAGHSLTFMWRDQWDAYPWACHGGEPGYASDLALSWRLQQAGVPIIAARDGEHRHVKALWNHLDGTPGRELLIGKEPARVVWDLQGGNL